MPPDFLPSLRIVLDTNVIMDLLHFKDPRTLALRQAIDQGRVACITDGPCFAEFERVLAYPAFAIAPDQRGVLLRDYRKFALPAQDPGEAVPPLPRCRDADDQKFLELAARSGASLLVTRDKMLLRLARARRRPLPFAVVPPEEAARLIDTPPENPAPLV